MYIKAEAILWRICNAATFDTLNGKSKGQYDIRLGTMACDEFFLNIHKTNLTTLGGYDLIVPIQPYTGVNSVGLEQISVHYMGEDSERKDWIIQSQRPSTAYPLWRPGRGVSTSFNQGKEHSQYLIMIRDANGGFHARWLSYANIVSMPATIHNKILNNDKGIISI